MRVAALALAVVACVLTDWQVNAPTIDHGFQIFRDGRLIRAEGRETGVWVFNPCDGERLWIPPGAVAAWGEPVPPETETH